MNKSEYIRKQKQHIKRMEKIIKAIEPFIVEDRSCDFRDGWNGYPRIRDAYNTAKTEIEETREAISNA